jgi:hypothetical protein
MIKPHLFFLEFKLDDIVKTLLGEFPTKTSWDDGQLTEINLA